MRLNKNLQQRILLMELFSHYYITIRTIPSLRVEEVFSICVALSWILGAFYYINMLYSNILLYIKDKGT